MGCVLITDNKTMTVPSMKYKSDVCEVFKQSCMCFLGVPVFSDRVGQ